jgi:hypothetical protein
MAGKFSQTIGNAAERRVEVAQKLNERVVRALKENDWTPGIFKTLLGPTSSEETAETAPAEKIFREMEFNYLIAACAQLEISAEFREEYFPVEPIAGDENEWKVCPHRFSEDIVGDEAIRQLGADPGCRLLNGSRRAMEYIADNPAIQLSMPLIVTAGRQFPDGYWYVPVFYWHGKKRRLILYRLDGIFLACCGWLVLRRRP